MCLGCLFTFNMMNSSVSGHGGTTASMTGVDLIDGIFGVAQHRRSSESGVLRWRPVPTYHVILASPRPVSAVFGLGDRVAGCARSPLSTSCSSRRPGLR